MGKCPDREGHSGWHPGVAPGGAPGGMPEVEGLSEAEKAKAKTSNYIFDKYLLSGVKDMKDPEGADGLHIRIAQK